MGKSVRRNKIARTVAPYKSVTAQDSNATSSASTQIPENQNKELYNEIILVLGELSNETNRLNGLVKISMMIGNNRYREEFLKQNLLNILFENDCANYSKEGIDAKITDSYLNLLKILVFEDGYSIGIHLWKKRNIWKTIVELFSRDKSELLVYLENLTGLIIGLINKSEFILDDIMGDELKINFLLANIVNLFNTVFESNNNDGNQKPNISQKVINSLLNLVYDFSSNSDMFLQKLIFEFGFNLERLIVFSGSVENKIGKIYVECIKFQLFEYCDSVNKETVLDRDENIEKIFIEIYMNLTSYLKSVQFDINQLILDSNNSNNNKLRFENVEFLQSVEISMDLITTIIEYCGTSLPIDTASENDLIKYFNSDVLISNFVNDVEFFEFLSKCLVDYELKFEINALYIFINLSILFNNLNFTNLPESWVQQLTKIWIFYLNDSEKSPILKHCEFKTDLIFNIHNFQKIFEFLNNSIDIIYNEKLIEESQLINNLNSVFSNFEEIMKLNFKLLTFQNTPKKKRKSNVFNNYLSLNDVKELNSLIESFYVEALQFLKSLAKLKSVNLNLCVGNFMILNLLSSESLNILQPSLIIDLIVSIFEIYSDKSFNYDCNFVNSKYVEHLKTCKDQLKNEIFKRKIDKNIDPVLKAQSNELIKELDRFIKYKENE